MRTDMRLTAAAEADRLDFVREYGHDGNCSCHLSPPCSSCMHPGNPAQQAEDDSAWEPDHAADAAAYLVAALAPGFAPTTKVSRDQLAMCFTTSAGSNDRMRELFKRFNRFGTSAYMPSVYFGTGPATPPPPDFIMRPIDIHRVYPIALYTPTWRGWLQERLEDRTAEAIALVVDRHFPLQSWTHQGGLQLPAGDTWLIFDELLSRA